MKLLQWLKKEYAIRKADRLTRRGNTQAALDEIENTLKNFPKNLELHIQRSWALADLKKFDEALQAVKQGLELFPKNAVLLLIQGEIYYSTQRFDEAKKILHQALEQAGENLRIEYALGLTYIALGDMDRAAQYFESSIRYDKTLVQSRLLAMAERYLFEKRPPNV